MLQRFLEKLKWYWKPKLGLSWRVDETYIKVKGKWAYLYRALDKDGNTIDFYLSSTRSINAAKRFLSKALRSIPEHAHPDTISIQTGIQHMLRHLPSYRKKVYVLWHWSIDRLSI